jgi:hypothetical protein
VLTILNQVAGVEQSYADPSGIFLRLRLRPGANADRVAGEVRRVLEQQVEDRIAVPLGGESAPAALGQEWQDEGAVTERAAAEARAEAEQAAAAQASERNWLLALLALLALAAVVVGLLVWWRRRARTGPEQADQPNPPPHATAVRPREAARKLGPAASRR